MTQDSAALLAHIISTTKLNLEFLISQNVLSQVDGREILSKLSNAHSDVNALSQQADRLSLMPEPNIGSLARRNVPPPPQRLVQARALWDYNENQQEPNDLSFRSGDVIEIIAETNVDWWTGKNNGRQGLFPANYVEKLGSSSPVLNNANRSSTPAYPPPQQQTPIYTAPYQPPPQSYQPPPGPPVVYNPYMSPPPAAAPAPAPAPPPPEQPKPSRFAGLGNTMAQSAAGGVGFGAGSAIGSGLINSIF